jgi:hypothetical protein
MTEFIAFTNFLEFHLPEGADCQTLRRIECSLRGEELYRLTVAAPSEIRTGLLAIFDFYLWDAIDAYYHTSLTNEQKMKRHGIAKQNFENLTLDENTVSIAWRFVDAADKYLSSNVTIHSALFEQLPLESEDARVKQVCDYYRSCTNDIFPYYVNDPETPFESSNLPSYHAKLPRPIPSFMCIPDDRMHILFHTASHLLNC